MKERKVKYSFAEWCKDNNHQDWLDRWDYELNGIGPEYVAAGSNKKYYFKCPRLLHPSENVALNNITYRFASLRCDQCHSIGQWIVDNLCDGNSQLLNKYWSDLNTISPYAIERYSRKQCYFKCISNTSHPDYLIGCSDFAGCMCCPVCTGHRVVADINSVGTIYPEFISHFVNQDDAFKYTVGSGQKVEFICPDCGNYYPRQIRYAVEHNFSCPYCGDGKSYPEKYVAEFLMQIRKMYGFHFTPEKTFSWSIDQSNKRKKKVYDFCIDVEDIILVEAHGRQHFQYGFDCFGGRTSEEECQNDILKFNLAINNGILEDHYIVLDCRESRSNWIKKSIMNSKLPILLHFKESDIDWDKCAVAATSNLIKKACDLWSSGVKNLRDISNQIGVSHSSVCNYVKKGDELGLIDYVSSMIKPVVCIENNYAFWCSSVCEKLSEKLFGFHISKRSITTTAHGDQKSAHGLHFKYITQKEFNQIKETEPYRVFE